MENEKSILSELLNSSDTYDVTDVINLNRDTREKVERMFKPREEKEYVIIMIDNTDFNNFPGKWSAITLLERVNQYTELPPNHKVAVHMQVAMLFNIDFVDMEDIDIRHAVLKRLLNKIEPTL